MSTDPHHREYAAAAACLSDQTPSGCRMPSDGDWVTFWVDDTAGGRRLCQGRVQQMQAAGRVVIEGERGSWFPIHVSQITEIAR